MTRAALLSTAAAAAAAAAILTLLPAPARGHCEIPCGIYGDHARIEMLREDVATIAKSVAEITALAGRSDALSVNQATRWTMNKEEHATRIQHTIAQYFMTQRIKPAPQGSPGWSEYVTRLSQHHAVMLAALRAKQTVDDAAVNDLRAAVEAIALYYPPDKVPAAPVAIPRPGE
jgi:nickel superoxide dismutase